MATLSSMAITTIKSTYSLDVESVRTLEALARRWGVSKSEVIRRSLRIAASTAGDGELSPLKALAELQEVVRERGVDLERWGRNLKKERRAGERRLKRWAE